MHASYIKKRGNDSPEQLGISGTRPGRGVRPRRIFPVLLLAALAIVFFAAAEGRARLLKDQAGRSVSVPDDPKRVVSLAPSVTEIIFALGEGPRLKAVTQHCDYPPEAQSLPKVGSYVHLDLERIVAADPDLCIGIRDGNPREVVEALGAMGIPVYVVNPESLGSVAEAFVEIGGLLNAGEKARHIAGEMRARIERVRSRAAEAKERPGVFFQIEIVPVVSVGTGTILHELITMAGGRNLGEGPKPYPRFSKEQVIALEPDIIIITSMAGGRALENARAEWKRYGELPAVRNDRIFTVDSNIFDRPTPRLVEGLEKLARIIHPGLF